MKTIWEGLLARLGLKRTRRRQTYALDEALDIALVEQATKEQRSAEEYHADLVAFALAQRQAIEDLNQRWEALSAREQDVTALTCLGYTNRQIAAKLKLKPETVKGYVQKVMIKFRLHGKGELRIRLGSWDFSKWGPEAPD